MQTGNGKVALPSSAEIMFSSDSEDAESVVSFIPHTNGTDTLSTRQQRWARLNRSLEDDVNRISIIDEDDADSALRRRSSVEDESDAAATLRHRIKEEVKANVQKRKSQQSMGNVARANNSNSSANTTSTSKVDDNLNSIGGSSEDSITESASDLPTER